MTPHTVASEDLLPQLQTGVSICWKNNSNAASFSHLSDVIFKPVAIIFAWKSSLLLWVFSCLMPLEVEWHQVNIIFDFFHFFIYEYYCHFFPLNISFFFFFLLIHHCSTDQALIICSLLLTSHLVSMGLSNLFSISTRVFYWP